MSKPSLTQNIKPSAAVIDLSAIVRAQAAVTSAKTFEHFSNEVLNNIKGILANCSRIDVITDGYFDTSLKAHTRDSRGVGQYFTFTPSTIIPKDFTEKRTKSWEKQSFT